MTNSTSPSPAAVVDPSIDLDRMEALCGAASAGPWFFANASVLSGPKVATNEAWWTDERVNDEHTYDHRVRYPCPACGSRCKLAREAMDQDPVVARFEASYGDQATGQRVADAEFIAAAREAVPALLAALREAYRRIETLERRVNE